MLLVVGGRWQHAERSWGQWWLMLMLVLESKMMMDGACDNIWRYIMIMIMLYQLSGWGWSSTSVLLDHAAPEVHVRAFLYCVSLRGRPVGRPSSVYYFWINFRCTNFHFLNRFEIVIKCLIARALAELCWGWAFLISIILLCEDGTNR